jgi:hypothetical protein
MITVKKIVDEMTEILKRNEDSPKYKAYAILNKKEVEQDRKRIIFLRNAKNYVELMPTEKAVKQQMFFLEGKISEMKSVLNSEKCPKKKRNFAKVHLKEYSEQLNLLKFVLAA